jgi:hypothetical protein
MKKLEPRYRVKTIKLKYYEVEVDREFEYYPIFIPGISDNVKLEPQILENSMPSWGYQSIPKTINFDKILIYTTSFYLKL